MSGALHPQELQYMRTENLPPHPGLSWALGTLVMGPGMRALDLGCGAGRDTRALVQAGFEEVIAVDHCPASGSYIDKHIPPGERSKVAFICGAYQDSCPEGPFDLINAQLTLSHNPRQAFDHMVAVIRQRLKSDGLFVGSFFGDRHPYKQPETPFTFLSRQEAENLFAGMTYVRLDEHNEEGPRPYAGGEQWHWFDVVVKNAPILNQPSSC